MAERDREKKAQDEANGTGCCGPEAMDAIGGGCCEEKKKGICGFIMRRMMKHAWCGPQKHAK